MKHTHLPFVLLFLACFTLGGCEKVIDVNTLDIDPYVAVVSTCESGQPVRARISLSRFFLDEGHTFVDYASAQLEVNGTLLPTPLTHDSLGVYSISHRPTAGDTMTLHVAVPGHDDLTAGCRVPYRPKATMSDLDYSDVGTDFYYDEYYDDTLYYNTGDFTFKINLTDPADEHNYYMLVVESRYLDTTYTTNWTPIYSTINDELLNPTDASSIMDILGGYSDNEFYFTDELINGKTHSISVSVNYEISQRFRVRLASLSRDLYLYRRTLSKSRDADGFFSEPVQIHSNINGGIGIFGAQTSQLIDIPLRN